MPDSVTRRTAQSGGPSQPPDADPSLQDRTEVASQAQLANPGSNAPAPLDGSSARARLEVGLDDQKTVISKRPVISETSLPLTASPSEMGRILVGERLGHFQLEEFVGGGGMGAVFRATDMMLGRTVAVKVLSREQ